MRIRAPNLNRFPEGANMAVAEDFGAVRILDSAAGLRRILWSSVIGTAVEWYDFLIYGAATALVFNKIFFAAGDPALATIAAFGTYAVGFLARPLGAAIFGHFGVRVGSMVQVGNPIGNIAAIGMFALVSQLPENDFMTWGWRIPFLISVLLVGVGLWIRLRMEETPAFRQIKAKNEVAKMPIVDIFKYHRRPFFTAVCLKISEIAYASIAGVFIMSYATSRLGLSRGLVLNGAFLSSLVALFSIPFFGWLSDKVGRKIMFYASCLFSALFAFPMFWLLDTRDPTIVILTIVVAISFGQMVMFGIGAPWYSELFTARLRYSGASLGFQVGAALSGGLSPLIAASLMSWAGGATWPVSVFLIVCALITAIATSVAPEMANKELI
jgi:MHS family shikimate/dehydroshikimate transporter-like MFS transporter